MPLRPRPHKPAPWIRYHGATPKAGAVAYLVPLEVLASAAYHKPGLIAGLWRVFRFVLWCKRYGKVQVIGCIYHTGGSK